MYNGIIYAIKILAGSGSQSTNFFSTKSLGQSNGVTPKVNFGSANTRNTVLESQCPAVPNCFNSKYRKIDGSCNRIGNRNSQYGKAQTPLQRIVDPAYSDGNKISSI